MIRILKYNGFYTNVNYEKESKTYWGKIESIKDVITFEADTIEKLQEEFKNTVDEYLNECKDLKKEIILRKNKSNEKTKKPKIKSRLII